MGAYLNKWPFPWTEKCKHFPRFVMAFDEYDIRVEMERIRDLRAQLLAPRIQITVTFGELKDVR